MSPSEEIFFNQAIFIPYFDTRLKRILATIEHAKSPTTARQMFAFKTTLY